jgi:hypothetical protein
MFAAVLKQKSRVLADGEDYKHSIHVIFECAGIPATDLKNLCFQVFKDHREQLDVCKRAKSFASIPNESLRFSPWIGADLQTMGGHTGFATMFSRKTQSDPCAQLIHRAVYHRGELYKMPPNTPVGVKNPKPFDPVDEPHEPGSLKADDALWLLYQGCCSAPKRYMSRLTENAEKCAKTQQSRTAARHHAVSGAVGGGRRAPSAPLGVNSTSGSPLPQWIRSVLEESGCGYTERKDSAQSYLKNLLACIAETEEDEGDGDDAENDREDGGDDCSKIKSKTISSGGWIAVHIDRGAMPCPMQLSEDPPVRHHHPNNGVILAVNKSLTQDEEEETIVYARCTSCRFSHTTNAHAVRVMRGKDSEFASPWLKLSRENFSAMLDASGENMVVDMSLLLVYLVFAYVSIGARAL